jgi:hypothetical protein
METRPPSCCTQLLTTGGSLSTRVLETLDRVFRRWHKLARRSQQQRKVQEYRALQQRRSLLRSSFERWRDQSRDHSLGKLVRIISFSFSRFSFVRTHIERQCSGGSMVSQKATSDQTSHARTMEEPHPGMVG